MRGKRSPGPDICSWFEDGRSGFTFDAAIAEINAKGYFLFTGSPKLLSKLAPSPVCEGPSNVC
jgi:hypothetical protein